MKKIAFLVITWLFALSIVKAQSQSPSTDNENVKESKVSKREMGTAKAPLMNPGRESVSFASKNSFGIDFPKATDMSWERSGVFDQVSFISDGQKLTGYYDSEGNLVGTTTTKKLADLPEKTQKILADKYADYKVGPIIFFHDNDQNDSDMVLWATQFDSEDLYFAELDKGPDKIVVQITPSGDVSYFTQIK
jgi:hypothetical protein